MPLTVLGLLLDLLFFFGGLFVVHSAANLLEDPGALKLLLVPAQCAVNRFAFFDFDDNHGLLPPFAGVFEGAKVAHKAEIS